MGSVKFYAHIQKRPEDRQGLVTAHGVLSAAEQIHCAHRAMLRYLDEEKTPGDKSIIWYLYFGAASAVAELRSRLMRTKVYEAAARAYLQETKPNLIPAFDRITAKQIATDLPLQMCCFSRNNYWAFWNNDVSDTFIGSLKFDGSDPPVIATTEDQSTSNTGVPWVKDSWTRGWKIAFKLTDGQLKAAMAEVKTLCSDAAKAGRQAGLGILQASGIRLERAEVEPAEVVVYSSGVRPGVATAATGSEPSS